MLKQQLQLQSPTSPFEDRDEDTTNSINEVESSPGKRIQKTRNDIIKIRTEFINKANKNKQSKDNINNR